MILICLNFSLILSAFQRLYDNVHVDVIHAGRSRAAREKAVAKFRKGETWILICTDLVARGVDFRAVNMVINYDLPSSGINYIHRIGKLLPLLLLLLFVMKNMLSPFFIR